LSAEKNGAKCSQLKCIVNQKFPHTKLAKISKYCERTNYGSFLCHNQRWPSLIICVSVSCLSMWDGGQLLRPVAVPTIRKGR